MFNSIISTVKKPFMRMFSSVENDNNNDDQFSGETSILHDCKKGKVIESNEIIKGEGNNQIEMSLEPATESTLCRESIHRSLIGAETITESGLSLQESTNSSRNHILCTNKKDEKSSFSCINLAQNSNVNKNDKHSTLPNRKKIKGYLEEEYCLKPCYVLLTRIDSKKYFNDVKLLISERKMEMPFIGSDKSFCEGSGNNRTHLAESSETTVVLKSHKSSNSVQQIHSTSASSDFKNGTVSEYSVVKPCHIKLNRVNIPAQQNCFEGFCENRNTIKKIKNDASKSVGHKNITSNSEYLLNGKSYCLQSDDLDSDHSLNKLPETLIEKQMLKPCSVMLNRMTDNVFVSNVSSSNDCNMIHFMGKKTESESSLNKNLISTPCSPLQSDVNDDITLSNDDSVLKYGSIRSAGLHTDFNLFESDVNVEIQKSNDHISKYSTKSAAELLSSCSVEPDVNKEKEVSDVGDILQCNILDNTWDSNSTEVNASIIPVANLPELSDHHFKKKAIQPCNSSSISQNMDNANVVTPKKIMPVLYEQNSKSSVITHEDTDIVFSSKYGPSCKSNSKESASDNLTSDSYCSKFNNTDDVELMDKLSNCYSYCSDKRTHIETIGNCSYIENNDERNLISLEEKINFSDSSNKFEDADSSKLCNVEINYTLKPCYVNVTRLENIDLMEKRIEDNSKICDHNKQLEPLTANISKERDPKFNNIEDGNRKCKSENNDIYGYCKFSVNTDSESEKDCISNQNSLDKFQECSKVAHPTSFNASHEKYVKSYFSDDSDSLPDYFGSINCSKHERNSLSPESSDNDNMVDIKKIRNSKYINQSIAKRMNFRRDNMDAGISGTAQPKKNCIAMSLSFESSDSDCMSDFKKITNSKHVKKNDAARSISKKKRNNQKSRSTKHANKCTERNWSSESNDTDYMPNIEKINSKNVKKNVVTGSSSKRKNSDIENLRNSKHTDKNMARSSECDDLDYLTDIEKIKNSKVVEGNVVTRSSLKRMTGDGETSNNIKHGNKNIARNLSSGCDASEYLPDIKKVKNSKNVKKSIVTRASSKRKDNNVEKSRSAKHATKTIAKRYLPDIKKPKNSKVVNKNIATSGSSKKKDSGFEKSKQANHASKSVDRILCSECNDRDTKVVKKNIVTRLSLKRKKIDVEETGNAKYVNKNVSRSFGSECDDIDCLPDIKKVKDSKNVEENGAAGSSLKGKDSLCEKSENTKHANKNIAKSLSSEDSDNLSDIEDNRNPFKGKSIVRKVSLESDSTIIMNNDRIVSDSEIDMNEDNEIDMNEDNEIDMNEDNESHVAVKNDSSSNASDRLSDLSSIYGSEYDAEYLSDTDNYNISRSMFGNLREAGNYIVQLSENNSSASEGDIESNVCEKKNEDETPPCPLENKSTVVENCNSRYYFKSKISGMKYLVDWFEYDGKSKIFVTIRYKENPNPIKIEHAVKPIEENAIYSRKPFELSNAAGSPNDESGIITVKPPSFCTLSGDGSHSDCKERLARYKNDAETSHYDFGKKDEPSTSQIPDFDDSSTSVCSDSSFGSNSELYCVHCNEIFPNRIDNYNHICRGKPGKGCLCIYCEKIFSSFPRLRAHKRKHFD